MGVIEIVAVDEAVRDCVGVTEDDMDRVLVSVTVTEAELVTDGDDVRLGVPLGETVGVIEIVAVDEAVRDCVLVSVTVTEAELVTDGDDVRLAVPLGEAVVDRVTVAVGHGVAVTVRVAVKLAVTLCVGVGVGVGDGMSVSRTMIFTPEYTTDTSVVHCKYAAGPEEYTWAGRPPPDCEKMSGEVAVGPS